jgi:hypothetical protein
MSAGVSTVIKLRPLASVEQLGDGLTAPAGMIGVVRAFDGEIALRLLDERLPDSAARGTTIVLTFARFSTAAPVSILGGGFYFRRWVVSVCKLLKKPLLAKVSLGRGL